MAYSTIYVKVADAPLVSRLIWATSGLAVAVDAYLNDETDVPYELLAAARQEWADAVADLRA